MGGSATALPAVPRPHNGARSDVQNEFYYTGRRVDPETGLYYYRARYYSPKLGRFLQTDPIGTKDDLNLYAYSRNDSINLKDSGGAEVVLASDTTPGQRAVFATTLRYLSRSPTFGRLYGTLQQSSSVFTVKFTTSEGHEFIENAELGGGTIPFNPTEGLLLETGDIMSAAAGFGHEVGHAEHFETDPRGYLNERNKVEADIPGDFESGVTFKTIFGKGETRAVQVENDIAAEVGEKGTRTGPKEGKPVKVPSATYSCEVGRRTPRCQP